MMQDLDSIVFMFVGGGIKKRHIDALIANKGPRNIISLPYQPLEELMYSLTAADVHVVSIGNEMVGVLHPSKIYGAMAAGRPILALGPEMSHIATIVKDHQIGWQVNHGDLEGLRENLYEILEMPREQLYSMGKRARRLAEITFSKQMLLQQFCDVVEGDDGKNL